MAEAEVAEAEVAEAEVAEAEVAELAGWRSAGLMGSRVRRSLATCAGRLRPASTSSSRAPISP